VDPRTTIKREWFNLYGQELPKWRYKTNDDYLLYRNVEKDSPTVQSYPSLSTLACVNLKDDISEPKKDIPHEDSQD
jgi:hypothetical protein